MKKLLPIIAVLSLGCTKTFPLTPNGPEQVYVYIKEIDNDGNINKTDVATSLVTKRDGYFDLSFEIASASDVNHYEVMVSTDGINFDDVRNIPATSVSPNVTYSSRINVPQ